MDFNFIPHPLVGTPFGTALDLCIVLSIAVLVISFVTRECSWVDRLWSLCPPIYCLIVASALAFSSTRVNLMALLVCLWGARLTFNFVRKGGFRPGGEDYRWGVMRERLPPVAFLAVVATFGVPGQMLIIWLFTAPIHQAWVGQDVPLNALDYIAVVLFLALLAVETVADEQMWAFQQDKKRRREGGEQIAQPFMATGLFRYSRHPNYAAELGQWAVFYLFAVAATGQWLHWSGLGFIALLAVFLGSIRVTESVSADKYAGYGEYQSSTPMLLPTPRSLVGR